MLKRLYIDNYKSLVNFELKPDYLCLLLGSNGSGKSAIFQVVSGIRSLLVENQSTADVFPTSTRTRWQDRDCQTFGIEVDLADHGTYYYHVEITHDLQKQSSHISLETLQHNGKFLFTFEEGKVNVYDDSYQSGPDFYWDSGFTGLGRIPETRTAKKAAQFMRWIDGATCVTVDPTRMKPLAETEDVHLSSRLENIAAWFRHLSQERMDDMKTLSDSLGDVIGLKSFALRMYGPIVRQLTVNVLTEGAGQTEFAFDELSDGQRALVGLYALLLSITKPDGFLFIDEPDNYVSLREVQPWLAELKEVCEDIGAQAILISHSSEVINYIASSYGVELRRSGSDPTTARPFRLEQGIPYSPAEAIAMGAIA